MIDKMLTASGRGRGKGPLTPSLTRGSVPGPHWRLCPQTYIIGSHYHACHAPPLQLLGPPVHLGNQYSAADW